MSRDDLQKLLGGYAAGTLTPDERDVLFAAALEDQELFDALMREEPLRELLQDPVAKSRLRSGLEVTARAPWYRGWLRPAPLTAAAAAILVVGVVMVERRTQPAQPVEIAKLEPVQRPAVVLPAPQAPVAAAPRPSLAETVRQHNGPRAKDEELQALQSDATKALKQAVAQNKPEERPANPVPLPAAPPADTQAALQAQPLAAPAGIRAGAAGGIFDLRDARALFSEPSPGTAPAFRSNLVKTESRGPVRAEAVNAPVTAAAVPPPAHLGLRYTVWRRPTSGIFEQQAIGAALNTDDEIQLRLQPNDFGYLYVFERTADGAWNLLATDRLARMAVYTLPRSGALRLGDSGVLELFVVFLRQPLPEQERQPVSPADQQMNGSPDERATYVVSTSNNPVAQRVGFPITLRVQSH